MNRSLIALTAFVVLWTSSASAQTAKDLAKKVEALEAEVARLAADAPTLASATTELTNRLTQVEQELARMAREHASVPDAVAKLDALDGKLAALEADVEELRTRVADLQQPGHRVGEGGGVSYDDGFRWRSEDGRYSLRIGGYAQVRGDATWAEDATGDVGEVENTLALRRSRFYAGGESQYGEFFVNFDPRLDTALLDYWFRVPVWKGKSSKLGVKLGQDRNAFTRNFMTWAPETIFLERPQAVNAFRYDRSVGLGIEGWFFDRRLYAYLGVVNGSGPGQLNDNLEAADIARVEAVLLGPVPERRHFGDVDRSPEPVLMVGIGGVHDLAGVPQTISGVEVANRDVDGNGEPDDVRVISASADVQFRWMGFELTAEGMYRRENWGTVFDHPDNTAVGELFEFDGERNYLGFYGDASYVLPRDILVGARVGHHRQTAFLVDGRERSEPPASKRQLEVSGTVQLLAGDTKRRFAGIHYRYLNDNNGDDPEVLDDEEHRLMTEFQFLW